MERRLAAIFAADIAGFSRLVGLDEEGTLAAQRLLRTELIDPLLQKFGGRLANTAGDSMLAEFPSAVEAIRCAIAVQQGMDERTEGVPRDKRIQYRIGINVGDIVSDADSGDLLGDGVNIAARLEGLAPAGGIVVSRAARDQVRDRIDIELADLGEINVKNIARPIRAFQVLRGGESPIQFAKPRSRLWRPLAAVAVAFALVSGGWFYFTRTDVEAADTARMAFPLPDKPSLAVLPFVNLADVADEDYFVDGLSEDVITELSKVSEIFVIAHRASYSYKDSSADLHEIAEKLGVRYILTGSVRKREDRIRVTAQLTDALSGRHVWADSYDRPLHDLFKVQADLATQIVTAMDVKLVSGALGRQRRGATENPEAYDLLVRGIREARRVTKESNAIGRQLFERALALDPDYKRARSWLATTYLWEGRYGWGLSRSEAIVIAEEVLGESDGHDSVRAVIHLLRGEYEAALRSREAAVTEFPNSADAQARLGQQLLLMGRPEEAIEHFQAAMRLSPVYPIWYLGRLGDAYRLAGRPDEAIAAFRGVLERKPDDIIHGRIRLVATLIDIDEIVEAQAEAARILEIKPSFTVTSYMKTRLYQDQGVHKDLRSALVAAGLPE